MQIEVNIDQDAVQQQLVQAITNSAIGAAIQAAISKGLNPFLIRESRQAVKPGPKRVMASVLIPS